MLRAPGAGWFLCERLAARNCAVGTRILARGIMTKYIRAAEHKTDCAAGLVRSRDRKITARESYARDAE